MAEFRDPITAGARIYIGGIAEKTPQEDIMSHFFKYGKINGVLVQRNFAFVQFDNDNSAMQAISMENGGNINGKKVIVKAAGLNPKRPTPAGPFVGQGGGPMMPMMNNMPNNMHNMNNNMNNMNNMQNMQNMPMHRARSRSPLNNMNIPPFNANMHRGGPGPGPGFHGGPPIQFPGPPVHQRPNIINDCEIIVVSRELTDYAEWVENQLKNVGISSDLLFPNEDIPIGKVLSNIATRGTSYAIVVTPENQGHRSINVTELFGDNSTEHRNMPVEDAIKFIHKNYFTKKNEIMNPQQLAITPIFPCTSLKEKHPDAIQAMLRMLADNMTLTALQYDRLLKYLGERREMQVKAEVGDESLLTPTVVATNTPAIPAIDSQQIARAQQIEQENMQKKIMEILNKPSLTETILKTEELKKEKAPDPEPMKNLTEDPKIKLALAALLRNNIINKVKK